jgi:hypothetical protein
MKKYRIRAAQGARRRVEGGHYPLRFIFRQSTARGGRAVLPPMMAILAQLLTLPAARRFFRHSAGNPGQDMRD